MRLRPDAERFKNGARPAERSVGTLKPFAVANEPTRPQNISMAHLIAREDKRLEFETLHARDLERGIELGSRSLRRNGVFGERPMAEAVAGNLMHLCSSDHLKCCRLVPARDTARLDSGSIRTQPGV